MDLCTAFTCPLTARSDFASSRHQYWEFRLQGRRKRKRGSSAEADVPPGLEQEVYDHEQEALAAVLDRDAPGKYTKVMGAAACMTDISKVPDSPL